MLAQCGDDLIGLRDRVLIAVGMAGALRRSELVALTTNDIEHTKEGILLTIRRSKGDQEGAGQVVSSATWASHPPGRSAGTVARGGRHH